MLDFSSKLKQVFSWAAAIVIMVVHTYLAFKILNVFTNDTNWIEIAKEHTAATLGIPLAGTASLFLVLVLRIVSDQVAFKIFNIEFKGAASQAIIWVFTYLIVIFSIYLLWPLAN